MSIGQRPDPLGVFVDVGETIINEFAEYHTRATTMRNNHRFAHKIICGAGGTRTRDRGIMSPLL